MSITTIIDSNKSRVVRHMIQDILTVAMMQKMSDQASYPATISNIPHYILVKKELIQH